MLIAFSGSSLSGKTTTINNLKRLFSNDNYETIFLEENIREYYDNSIDDVRNDPDLYLDIQIKAISTKIENEINLQKYRNSNTIVFIDRSISDSLFYCLHYVNSNNFNNDQLKQYSFLIEKIKKHINSNPYDILINFGILENSVKSDRHRPFNIHDKKHLEFNGINLLSNLINCKKLFIDPSKLDFNNDFDYISLKETLEAMF